MSKKLPKPIETGLEFRFAISKIEDLGFSILRLKSVPKNIKVGYGVELNFEEEENIVEFTIKASFTDFQTKEVFLSGKVLTQFRVMNLSKFSNKIDDTYEFPGDSMVMLFSMAFTHNRAILAKNVSGSIYSNIIIPVVDPKAVLADLLNHQLEDHEEF